MEAAIEKSTLQAYPAYKDSGVEWLGEIPEHWNMLPIRAVFEERNEKNVGPKTDYILSVTKDRGVIPYDEKGAIGNNKSEDIERYKVVYKGDFVINKMNVVIGSLGMSKYFGAFSQVYLVYKPKSSKININYYSYIFSNPSFYKSLIRYCTGIMELRESLNKDDFKKLILPFPEYSIQSKIVNYLDDKTTKIDQAIVIKQKQIELLKERRLIIIQDALTKGLNSTVALKPSGVKYISRIPEHWEVKKAKYTFSKLEQGWSPQCDQYVATKNEWGVLKVGCVNGFVFKPLENKVLPKNLNPKLEYIINERDILISRANTIELVGSAACVKNLQHKLLLCDKLFRIKLLPDVLLEDFFIYNMQTTYSRWHIEINANGASSSMQNIGQETIKNILIILPPVAEQKEIIYYIETVSTKIATAISLKEQEIDKLKEYKMSLIDGVVTGKVRIN